MRTATRVRDPDRKIRIIAAAAELIGEKGYYAVSMADIGEAAGITGSGIYRHFESKAAILVVLFDQVVDDLLEVQAGHVDMALSPPELLREMTRSQVRFVVHRREFARVYYSEIGSLPEEDRSRLRRKQRRYLEEWVNPLLEYHPELDDAEARTIIHAAVGAIQSALFHRAGLDDERLTTRLQRAAEAVLGLP